MRITLSFLFFILLLSATFVSSALEVAVVFDGKTQPNVLVEITDNYGEEYCYMTDENGIAIVDLEPDYYYIYINLSHPYKSSYKIFFDGNLYLTDEKINYIKLDAYDDYIPGFDFLLVVVAISICIFFIYKKRN